MLLECSGFLMTNSLNTYSQCIQCIIMYIQSLWYNVVEFSQSIMAEFICLLLVALSCQSIAIQNNHFLLIQHVNRHLLASVLQ